MRLKNKAHKSTMIQLQGCCHLLRGGSSIQTRKRPRNAVDIPQEFRIESFQSLKNRLGVQDKSVERLSLARIAEAAKKHTPYVLEEVEKYYARTGWLLAAAELAKPMSSVGALERAEQYYMESEFYRSAAEIAERIGTPEALERARRYRSVIC